jgi:epoxide hydrolase
VPRRRCRHDGRVSDDIIPFLIDVPEAELEDLRQRLRRTRWPEAATVGDWSQGIPLDYARELCRYWLEDYDWRSSEARLNGWPQFRTEIDGLDIHFLHVRSPREDALPLVITHGWPGSIVEFGKVIGPLTDPAAYGGDAADAFHLVCPSLPGYGFSGKPSRPGWGTEHTGDAWDQLMIRLGYPRYAAQGGDWGAQVTTAIGARHPDHVAGIHLNMPVVPPDPATMDDLTEREKAAIATMDYYRKWDSGYSKQQSTRPQTIGYSLLDSPAGLCAWIIEKFWSWTDCHRPHQGRDARQRHAVLAARHRRVVRPAVLGEFPHADPRDGDRSGRLLDLPEGDLPPVPPVGGAPVPGPALLERAVQGRSLRRVRAA